jgi:hypothetical protein
MPWSSRLGVGRGADNLILLKKTFVEKLLKSEERQFWKRLQFINNSNARIIIVIILIIIMSL